MSDTRAQGIVIYAEYKHWWQRLWVRLRGKQVLWSGSVLPPEAMDLDADSITVVWDNSGRFWVVPPND
jgi:hypothetical protein